MEEDIVGQVSSSGILFLVVHWSDQTKPSIHHFVTPKRTWHYVYLIEVLQNIPLSKLHIFTMTDEHATGPNHIADALRQTINVIRKTVNLSIILFLYHDNCLRVNNNKHVMEYLEALICLGVFNEIGVWFLPVGHTHSDIHPTFRTTSSWDAHKWLDNVFIHVRWAFCMLQRPHDLQKQ